VNLSGVNLEKENLSGANLGGANLSNANLFHANLSGADLSKAYLKHADLRGANLSKANLSQANLDEASLFGANVKVANLSGAIIGGADLCFADFGGANLTGATLYGSHLRSAKLNRANLSDANLEEATLVETDLTDADLTGCHVYGLSAWELRLSKDTKQQNLVITRKGEAEITTDDIEVAQFLYLMLHNEKIRKIVDTITSKVVLILGRFTQQRKAVLDALRNELRSRGYVPVVFDFDKAQNQTIGETVALLARMARFVIADLSDAKSVLQELRDIVPNNPMLAVQPLVIATQDEPGMFDFFRKFPWVLKTHRYDSLERLRADLDERVIRPAEAKVLELRGP
jgi:uncharacterized protein YjbI with pentapeptide repeats